MGSLANSDSYSVRDNIAAPLCNKGAGLKRDDLYLIYVFVS